MIFTKRFISFALLFFSFSSAANSKFFLESGVGVEYGGIGVQAHLPTPANNLDLYLATGLFYASNKDSEKFGLGVGGNYFFEKHHALSSYIGTLHIDSNLNDYFEVEHDVKRGVSIGYKYYFNGAKKSGFTAGFSYNIYNGGSYPFISLAYRFY
ncbi:hypothetical protein FJ444_06730 [Aestuariibacter sp. GS-14]|uniref:hypothetical protein n=1 Tax=Aestuariibacter sp. GS-14 TaxID=2590670 RepID=UPI00112A855A|nr:hypothetical protein [Aestuariibacter sp. GS-14]TPV59851.1 hypothetical protein FJ444_06730 [Aestuariibacter sp. GS-14]